ncbi:hypothetical protein [Hymenobacter sp. AT01-02]|uniref:hypothetical protein n=1 Tax=Hymenobacter sp. AT01-02 TaxID=1571877 RepID=UPI0005F15651|nr:hypothetical protein [Hymenobacter sp. AT01-02]
MSSTVPRLYQLNGICLKALLESRYTPVFTKKNLWKYHYFLTNILHKRRETTLPKGWVVLNVKKLRKALGNSKLQGKSFQFVDKIREDLYEWKILLYKYTITTHEGLVRKKSLAKIKDEVLAMGWKQWVPNLHFKLPAPAKDNTTQGVYQQIKKSLKHLRLDAGAALDFCDTALQIRLKVKSKMEGWMLNQDRRVNTEIHSSWITAVDALQDAIKLPLVSGLGLSSPIPKRVGPTTF